MFKFSHVRFRLFLVWNIHTVVFLHTFVTWLFFFCWCWCCFVVCIFSGCCNQSSSARFLCCLLVIVLLLIIFIISRFVQTGVSRWFFTRVSVRAILLKSPELFSVFWPISAMLQFGLSPFILLFPCPLVLLPILCVILPRAPIIIGITVTFIFHSFFSNPLKSPGTYLSFRFLSILLYDQPGQQSWQFGKFPLLLLLLLLLLPLMQ